MLVVAIIMFVIAIVFWFITSIFLTMNKNESRIYSEATVVGYLDAGRDSELKVKLKLNGEEIMSKTDMVESSDFPIGSKIRVSYNSSMVNQRRLGASDLIQGIVLIETPKYQKRRKRDQRKFTLLFGFISTIVTIFGVIFLLGWIMNL